MALYHLPLYEYAIAHLDISSLNGVLTFASVLVSIFIGTIFLLSILAFISSRLLKLFAIFMAIGNSIALYFVVSYHVILDRTMMGNMFNTDMAETVNLYHPKIFIYLILLGIIPALIISKIKIEKTPRIRLLFRTLLILVVGIFVMYLNATTWLWLDKNAKRLGGMTMPWSYTINAIRYKVKALKHNKKQILLPSATFINNDKMLVVLVIGESARSENFSLYGYKRDTNPLLGKTKNISVLKARSTATYTTASVHSMLSYTGSDSDDYEPLPNYLQREGVDVLWRTNNWGAPTLHVGKVEKAGELRSQCIGEDCDHDGVLLTNLEKEISRSKKNKTFVVLHTNGSHGPTYYKKYPKAFEVFTPACKTVNLQACTHQELINAYDNTILYTDYFLHQTITILKKFNDRPTMLIYASDHGESLGEYGLYLHGTPYSIAPDFQKDIPFLIWESDSFKKKNSGKIDTASSYGQDNIFHTVMGAFDMNSSIYDNEQNILAR